MFLEPGSDEEFDHVRKIARDLGFFAQVHAGFDPGRAPPGREDAFWYLQRSKKQNPTVAPHEVSILKFARASEVLDWLYEYRMQEMEKAS